MKTPSHDRVRRRLLKTALATTAIVGGPPMINLGRYQVFAAPAPSYSARAVELVQRCLVIDMLAPLKLDFRPEAFAGRLTEQQAADFRSSGITAFHHATGVLGLNVVEDTLSYLAGWQGFVGRNSDLLTLVGEAGDLEKAKRQNKIAVIMGVQDAAHFREPGDVEKFYRIGQRCAQLTYNAQNLIGSGCMERNDGGVSEFGSSIIEAMNDAGMLIDVSHCGDRTTLDAIDISVRPIAITHSNCRALNDHRRLKTDEAIRKLAAKGGVMGISGVRNYIRDKEPTTVEHLVDHIDHVVKLVGIEHVGIGSDLDLHGYDDMPPEQLRDLRQSWSSFAFREKLDTDGFDHPRRTFDLTETLIRRGYSDANIEAILGANFHRLLAATWK